MKTVDFSDFDFIFRNHQYGGAVLSGVIADVTKVDALIINNVALVFSAVLLFVEPFCTTYPLLVLFAALYGLCVCKCLIECL